MITSLTNRRVQLVRSLRQRRGREREGAFLLEGTRLISESLQFGAPRLVFYGPDFGKRDRRERYLLDRLHHAGADVQAVSADVLRAVSDTVTPAGVIGAMPLPAVASPATATPLALVLDGLADPGNAGAVLRVAVAAGVSEALALHGNVDLWNPKVVRAAAGAHFQLPIQQDLDWPTVHQRLGATEARWLTDPHGGVPYWQPDWALPSALVVSNETRGASSEAALWTGGNAVTVPMATDRRIDSLNVGVAAGIILFEALRQRAAGRSEQG